MKKNEKKEDIEIDISDLLPSSEEKIKIKSRYYTFSKQCVWLICHFKDQVDKNEMEEVYTRDIEKTFKISSSRALQVLKELVDIGLLEQKKLSGNFSYFIPIKNSDRNKLEYYMEYFRRTLKR